MKVKLKLKAVRVFFGVHVLVVWAFERAFRYNLLRKRRRISSSITNASIGVRDRFNPEGVYMIRGEKLKLLSFMRSLHSLIPSISYNLANCGNCPMIGKNPLSNGIIFPNLYWKLIEMTLTYITKHLDTELKCVKYLEEKRWNGTPKCPYCGGMKCSPKSLRYTCLSCKKSFSVRVGTVFESSNLPLTKWFMAIVLNLSSKKGISSLQLARDISVNKNTAWLLQVKLRHAMKENAELFVHIRSTRCGKKKIKADHKVVWKGSRLVFSRKLPSKQEVGRLWNHMRRAIIGQFHRIDEFYLENYLDEIKYKYDRRQNADRGYEELITRLCFQKLRE